MDCETHKAWHAVAKAAEDVRRLFLKCVTRTNKPLWFCAPRGFGAVSTAGALVNVGSLTSVHLRWRTPKKSVDLLFSIANLLFLKHFFVVSHTWMKSPVLGRGKKNIACCKSINFTCRLSKNERNSPFPMCEQPSACTKAASAQVGWSKRRDSCPCFSTKTCKVQIKTFCSVLETVWDVFFNEFPSITKNPLFDNNSVR
ncbi:hypothetical protein TRVL_08337 [Trypanosoma vivax]|nr:hypothetical protein TRVL_08337 [Trypanosoma vivax]